MFRRFFRAETGIFLAVWLTLMVGGRSRLFLDPGTFWHTVVGERILDHGFFDTDPFSYTHEGREWIPHQWLAEVGMALLHRAGGWDPLLLVTTALLAGLYTLLGHRLLRSGLHWSLTGVVLTLVIGASAIHFHVRPHIVSIVFLGLTFAWLCDFEAGRIPLTRLFWLVPLFAVWTNVHGGMLGGLGTLGLVVAGWGVLWLLSRAGGTGVPPVDDSHRRDAYATDARRSPITNLSQATLLGLLVIACGLTAFLNPYGIRLPQSWFAIMGSPVLSELIVEHKPLDPRNLEEWGIILVGAFYVATLIGTWPRRPRVTWLIPLIWLYLATDRIRHGPLFCITAGLAIAEMLPYTSWAGWLGRRGDLYTPPIDGQAARRSIGWPAVALPGLVLVTAVILQQARVEVPIVGHRWAQHDRKVWPVAMVPELSAAARETVNRRGERIFNDLNLGGFLIFHARGLKVFIDDRCELYGDAFLQEYWHAAVHEPERIKVWEAQYDFRLALTLRGSNFDRYLRSSGRWEVVRETHPATLHRRTR